MRKSAVLLITLLLLLGVVFTAQAQTNEIIILEAEGPVTPAMANYIDRGIERAQRNNAEALVLVLDTPGGNLEPTQDIVQSFRAATVPIIVYVSPRGAQAASAGSIITMAAHVAGMSPETVIGAASPVGDGGAELGETISRKLIEDLTAQMRSLTQDRNDDARDLAVAMIVDARAVNAGEALEIGLIDLVADDLPDLLAQLDGYPVEVNGETVTLETAVAPTTTFSMSSIEQILHLLTNPLLIGILFAVGVQAILLELSNPGGWVAGFVGVVCLVLAIYGVGQLPVNWLGLAFILIAFVLFVLEVKTVTHGALAVTGAVMLVVGFLVLFNSPGTPEFARISITGAVGISIFTSALFIFILSKAVRAQAARPTTGVEGLIGKAGPVRAHFDSPTKKAPYNGMVLINGELWQAEADEALQPGDRVVTTAVEGFTLHVKKAEE